MNELDTPIGTEERQMLSAGSVLVKEVKIEPAKEGSKAKVVRLVCKHPDRETPITLSNVKVRKVQGNNETIKRDTLWWNVEEKTGNIRKNSVLADFLRFYNKQKLQDFINTEIKVEPDASGYPCIKIY